MDQPIIVYDHKNGKEKGKFKRANPLDVIRAQKEWNEKYEGKNNDPIKLDFSSFSLTQSGNNNQ